MSEPAAPVPKITAALVAAMQTVSAVGKRGYNTDQKFKYRKYDDILTVANNALATAGVAITPSVVEMQRATREVTTKTGNRRTVTTTVVTVDYKLACAEDGSYETIRWFGEASDYGDKSLGKALSYAEKMMLIEVLKIPVDTPDMDPDANSHAEDAPVETPPRQRTGTRGRKAPAAEAAPPVETDSALMESLTADLAPFEGDPRAAGGKDALARVWGEVERGRLAGKLAVDDYNALSAHVKLIIAEIDAAEAAERDRIRTHRPEAAEADPWADEPSRQYNADTMRNEPVDTAENTDATGDAEAGEVSGDAVA